MRAAAVVLLVAVAGCGKTSSPTEKPPSEIWEEDGVRLRGEAFRKDDLLVVRILVQSTIPDKRINFRSWANGCTATDSKGNKLMPQDTARAARLYDTIASQTPNIFTGSGTVDSGGRDRIDILIFDGPVLAADGVEVELEGKNVGLKDPIKLKMKLTPEPSS